MRPNNTPAVQEIVDLFYIKHDEIRLPEDLRLKLHDLIERVAYLENLAAVAEAEWRIEYPEALLEALDRLARRRPSGEVCPPTASGSEPLPPTRER